MKLRVLSPEEAEAVMRYARDLHEGKVNAPESVTRIDEELQEAIRNAALFMVRLRVVDYSLVETALELMFEKDAAWARAALEYMPSRAIH